MAGWLEVATIAFVAQLSVLPGEKAQFIVAGLSTRYDPLVVVAAAGSAFAGWTALEIALGNALRGALPQVFVDVGTGLLFLAFAGLLLRSAPSVDGDATATDGGIVDELRPSELQGPDGDRPQAPDGERAPGGDDDRPGATDGGRAQAPGCNRARAGSLEVRLPVLGRRVPTALGNFLPIFALMAMGEFGDKTQLVTIGLATQYAHGTAIWAGEMAAILPVTLLNAFFFARFSHRFDLRRAHLLGAALFAFFGVDTLQAAVTGVSAWETLVGAAAGLVGTALPAAAI